MEFSAEQIAQLLGGTVEGNPSVTVNNIAKIEDGKPGCLSFLANPKYEDHLYNCDSSIILVNNDLELKGKVKATLVRVPDAYLAFAGILKEYQKLRGNKIGIHAKAIIEESAKIGKDVYIGAGAYIGENTVIEDGAKIYPNATINENCTIGKESVLNSGVQVYHDCVIGSKCTIHSGVIIGSDGFGFAPSNSDELEKVPQIGNVILEDEVEVGANTTIDRATIGSTIIRKGAKLDNLVQIAHNVEVGENTVIAAQTGVAGSTKIGKNCMFGGQVGIVGHITIADEVKIAAQSGVSQSITDKGKVVQGSPAFDIGSYRKSYVYFRKLPELARKM